MLKPDCGVDQKLLPRGLGAYHGYKVCDTLHQRLLLSDGLPQIPGSTVEWTHRGYLLVSALHGLFLERLSSGSWVVDGPVKYPPNAVSESLLQLSSYSMNLSVRLHKGC